MRIVHLAMGIALTAAAAATTPAAAQNAAVLGQVVDDATGAAMGGVTIAYRHPQRARLVRYWNGQPTGLRSDAGGTFVVPANLVGYELVAIDPDTGCSGWVLLSKGARNLQLRVVAGNVITGVARRGADGPAMANVVVRFRVVTDRGEQDGPGATTDDAGRYRIAGVPVGLRLRPDVEPSPRIKGARRSEDRSDLVTFEGLGESATRDLEVIARPGVEIVWTLRRADGQTMPRAVQVTHEVLSEEPAVSGVRPRQRSATRKGVTTTEQQWLDGGMFYRRKRRIWTETIDPASPTLALYLPEGQNRVAIGAGPWGAVLPTRTVTTAVPPETATITLQRRPLLLLQLVDLAGAPAARPDVRVSMSMTVRRGPQAMGFGLGTGTTDAAGRYDLTPHLPVFELRDDDVEFTLYAHLSGRSVSFPSGARLTWKKSDLHAMLAQAGPEGIFIVTAEAAPPVAVVLRFVDQAGAAVADTRINPQISGVAGDVTDADGRVTLQLPPGTHHRVRFHLGRDFEWASIETLKVPVTKPVVVKVTRILAFQVPLAIEGDTPERRVNPGRAAVQALDADGKQLANAQVSMGRTPERWQLWVRAPIQTTKIVLTLRDQTLEIPTPDGKPVDVPVWKLK